MSKKVILIAGSVGVRVIWCTICFSTALYLSARFQNGTFWGFAVGMIYAYSTARKPSWF
jgi:hypothetical protein